MRYISTRGGMARKSFSKILLAGLASDGGLVIPETYPVISSGELRAWRNFTYQELAFEIFLVFQTIFRPMIYAILFSVPIPQKFSKARILLHLKLWNLDYIFLDCQMDQRWHLKTLPCNYLATCLNTCWQRLAKS